jgi:hypothetical protein
MIFLVESLREDDDATGEDLDFCDGFFIVAVMPRAFGAFLYGADADFEESDEDAARGALVASYAHDGAA